MHIPSKPSGGNSIVPDDRFLYTFKQGKIYRMHTEYTFGKTGSVERIICRTCKRDMLKGGEYYCPYCHA